MLPRTRRHPLIHRKGGLDNLSLIGQIVYREADSCIDTGDLMRISRDLFAICSQETEFSSRDGSI
jgi:hypothetical protein